MFIRGIVVSVLFLVVGPLLGQEVSPDDVIKRYVDSLGGMDKVSEVTGLSTMASIAVPDQRGLTQTSAMTQHQQGNKFLLIVDMPDFGEVRRGSDGETYWTKDPKNGVRIIEGEEKEALREQFAFIFPVLSWNDFDGKISYEGNEEVDGETCHKLLFKPTKGEPVTRFFQKESGNLVQVETYQQTNYGRMTIQIYSSNFKAIEGVTLPLKQVTSTAAGDTTISIESFEVNPDFEDDMFALPSEVKELLKEQDQ